MNTQYDDILELPHHVSTSRPQMSMTDRAAQFSPFAALTGYDAAIRETSRLTSMETELTEDALDALDQKFRLLTECYGEKQEVCITYFQSDSRKAGGAYVTISGVIKKCDPVERILFLNNGTVIPMDHITEISSQSPDTVDGYR